MLPYTISQSSVSVKKLKVSEQISDEKSSFRLACDAVFLCYVNYTLPVLTTSNTKPDTKKCKKNFRILVLFQQRYFEKKKISQGEQQNTLQSQIQKIKKLIQDPRPFLSKGTSKTKKNVKKENDKIPKW
jgi:hypothetical protein